MHGSMNIKSVCLSWLSDIYGRVGHSVYKIRSALRTLKVIGVNLEDFHILE